jgi:hypothetical protein
MRFTVCDSTVVCYAHIKNRLKRTEKQAETAAQKYERSTPPGSGYAGRCGSVDGKIVDGKIGSVDGRIGSVDGKIAKHRQNGSV